MMFTSTERLTTTLENRSRLSESYKRAFVLPSSDKKQHMLTALQNVRQHILLHLPQKTQRDLEEIFPVGLSVCFFAALDLSLMSPPLGGS